MPVYNSDIAKTFNKLADLLEIEGANQFRVRAYRNAARTIGTLSSNSLERYADKSAQNLLSEIQESKEQPLARFLYALGIPLAGEHIVRVLASHFETLDDLMGASRADLEDIHEIGPEVADSIVTFFAEEENRRVIQEMREAGLKLNNPMYGAEDQRPLEGLTFVFTGSQERWTRDEVKRLVERWGGRATSSVSGETNYVVAGPGAGSKLDEAREHDVPVMDEEEFLEFVDKRR